MKLSEVINSKTKNTFKNSWHNFNKDNDVYSARVHEDSIIIAIEGEERTTIINIPLDGWEEVKPPRQWSEKELMLFKLLPDWAKWISRDLDDGSVFVFSDEPLKNRMVFKNVVGQRDFLTAKGTILDDILTITFEESPVYIGDLKGE